MDYSPLNGLNIDPSQLQPFVSAKRVIKDVEDFIAEHYSDEAYQRAIMALQLWQEQTMTEIVPLFEQQAMPGTEMYTLLVLSHNAGMKLVRRLHLQLVFLLWGGRWAFRDDWDVICN